MKKKQSVSIDNFKWTIFIVAFWNFTLTLACSAFQPTPLHDISQLKIDDFKYPGELELNRDRKRKETRINATVYRREMLKVQYVVPKATQIARS